MNRGRRNPGRLLCAWSAWVVACAAAAAPGQLAPVRECALVGRPVLVRLGADARPAGEGEGEPVRPPLRPPEAGGGAGLLPPRPRAAPGVDRPSADWRIELISAETMRTIESRPVRAGEVDLAAVFPRLWKTEAPAVLLAQAVDGEARVGPPVVLVPMVAPRYAPRTDREGTPVFNPAPRPRPLAGYWTFTDQHAVLRTGRGDLTFRLRAGAAPASVMHFRDLVKKGFYDGVPVHRVASLRGQPLPDLLQLGDPTGTGHGGPGTMIDFEESALKQAYGVLSFARAADPNSAGSQVIVALSREGAAALEGKYAAFGELVAGGAALVALAKTPVDADGRPREPVIVEKAELVDAPPAGAGPRPVEDPIGSAGKGR